MTLIRILCVSGLLLSVLVGEEVTVDRVTLKDGRVLDGTYNKEAGTIDLSPTGTKATLNIKAEDVTKTDKVTLTIKKADPKERATRQLRLVKAMMATLDAKLPTDPQAAMAEKNASIEKLQKEQAEAIAAYDAQVKKRNDYANEIALKEGTTRQITVGAWNGQYDARASDNNGNTATGTATGNEQSAEVTVTTVDMTPARRALAGMDANLKSDAVSIFARSARIYKVQNEKEELGKLMKERESYARQIPGLETIINAP